MLVSSLITLAFLYGVGSVSVSGINSAITEIAAVSQENAAAVARELQG